MRLPNADNAVVDLAKLRDYCLNPKHPRGRHKARVFADNPGITAEDAELLRQAILEAAFASEDAALGKKDGFGRRYLLDFSMTGSKGAAMVRSLWIVRTDEDFPRLATCYVR